MSQPGRSSLRCSDPAPLTVRGSSAFWTEPPPGYRLQHRLRRLSPGNAAHGRKAGLANLGTLGWLISGCLSEDLHLCLFKHIGGLRAGCTEIHLCHIGACTFENLRYVLKPFAYKGEYTLFALWLSNEDQGLCPKENQGTSDLMQRIFQASDFPLTTAVKSSGRA